MLSKALSVAAAKAKVTGLVIAAAALGSSAAVASSTTFVPTAGEDTVVTPASGSPSPSAPQTTPAATPEASATPTPTATLPPCTGEEKNHGAYVSSVAKDKTVKGREHGTLVSAAAHSDCGKEAGSEVEPSQAPEVEASESPEASARAEKTTKKNKHGRGRS